VVDDCCVFLCLKGGVMLDDGSTVDTKWSSHIFRPEWSLLTVKFTKICSEERLLVDALELVRS